MPITKRDETNGQKIQWNKCYRVTDSKGEHVPPTDKTDREYCFTDKKDWNDWILHKFAFWRGFTGLVWALFLGVVIGSVIVYITALPWWMLLILISLLGIMYVIGERMERTRWGDVDENNDVDNPKANGKGILVRPKKSRGRHFK